MNDTGGYVKPSFFTLTSVEAKLNPKKYELEIENDVKFI